jgi:hypothetical protein
VTLTLSLLLKALSHLRQLEHLQVHVDFATPARNWLITLHQFTFKFHSKFDFEIPAETTILLV